jgi:hypothetical protein
MEFVSISEQLDTSTPVGKMVFTVLGAVAELERGLIVEWMEAGLRSAPSERKRRPKKFLDTGRVPRYAPRKSAGNGSPLTWESELASPWPVPKLGKKVFGIRQPPVRSTSGLHFKTQDGFP